MIAVYSNNFGLVEKVTDLKESAKNVFTFVALNCWSYFILLLLLYFFLFLFLFLAVFSRAGESQNQSEFFALRLFSLRCDSSST